MPPTSRRRPSAFPAVTRPVAVLLFLVACVAPCPASGAGLVWHVESEDGAVVASSGADLPVNPASVVKAATTLWALERLGPEHRFRTTFDLRGSLDPETGVLDGDLVVSGSGDPDFHVENAFLAARELNRLGLREVTGALVVDDRFWIGWEGGPDRRLRDPGARARQMAGRLRDAFDPSRWSAATRRSIEELIERRGTAREPMPVVRIHGPTERRVPGAVENRSLLVHLSNPLVRALKRLNSYSNNDVERLSDTLGGAEELAAFLTDRWEVHDDALRLSTLSGLGTNRMSPRQVVRLLEDLRKTCARLGLQPDDVLPVAGCDPGTLEHFSLLRDGSVALTAKTGTLTRTDGGVAVLAGFAGTAGGELTFCVVAPRSGDRLARARDEQQRWLVDLVDRHGGSRSATCRPTPGHSDDEVLLLDPERAGSSPPASPPASRRD